MEREALKLAFEWFQCYADKSMSRNNAEALADEVIEAITAALAQPAQEPVAWMSNEDFEPIRVRIMQEAYELADRNDSEGYNAIKVMCGDVQRMLPPQRERVVFPTMLRKMMTVRDMLESPTQSSPDGKHWEPALPSYLGRRIRIRDAWAVWKGEATAIRQTTKADIEAAHGIKEKNT